ncbi:MAG: nucleotidyltransferase family protein [Sulfitobacter litoralis]|jgi:molybdenum cofactor cytidylyltransferase|uniref:Nucleotidyltransferase family protein n=2 Tax=root TaxID=1 RepID=A0A7V1A4N4_9RHOB|nr:MULTISPECIES: nucleotidyltransferase family protein [Sulfitobacter]MBQ0764723.1 nucleotidyltransferase family protein [Sulfitobacter litoralis]MCF7725985.1 NTP transferase domain-containing protein [Sulfitobacter sp. M22]MCF7777311.1 NTP transferase domain-containing protein [Sulfitobacter sp. M220]HDY94323.1 nucleotidyltransferase family protein [Sulfitobacter litoralis]HDZ50351.1 nucleotidyltransferase family protein [Sulfitobacter litoralis]|tara:strand:+ start:2403 stop:3005 length:603 start_codon:yes stop_codon:yes gene_type:complete
MRDDIPIILLAAGQSSRMRGRDKLTELIDAEPLLRRQARIARAVTKAAVIVALPPAPHPRYDLLRGLDVTLLPVPDAAEGINASLRAGFAALPSSSLAAMILLADLPELTEGDLRYVMQSVDLKTKYTIWRGATSDGKAGHPTVFAAYHFNRILQMSGDTGAKEIIAQAQAETLTVPLPGNRARLDLDTPEAWAAWRAAR